MVGGVLRVLGKILPPGLPDRLIELGNGVMPDIRHQWWRSSLGSWPSANAFGIGTKEYGS